MPFEEQHPEQPQDRTLYGLEEPEKRPSILPTKDFIVTPILLALNVLMFLLMALSGVDLFNPTVPDLIDWGANLKPLTLNGEWWRMFSSMFIHIGVLHLLFNGYALFYLGRLLEPLLGPGRFLMVYLLSGLAGSVASLYWNDVVTSAGASGAIFGIMGVLLALLISGRVGYQDRQSLIASLMIFLGYNLLNGFTQTGIDNSAHIGGLVGGAILGLLLLPTLLYPDQQLRNRLLTWGGSLGMLLFLGIVTVTMPNFALKYDELISEFATYEERALQVYELPNSAPQAQYVILLRDTGLYYWEKAGVVVEEIQEIPGLPEVLLDQGQKFEKYVDLRKEEFGLHLKRLNSSDPGIGDKIEVVQKEIEDLLYKMNAVQ